MIAMDAKLIVGGATALLGGGLWLMLPRGAARGRALGTVLVLASFGLFASRMPLLGNWAADGVFYILAAVTVVAAACTITFRSPVYSALWFALSLLGTAGLFLFQGSQFLGVATVVVYAGAILVTFLFVLMLAQPKGHSFYDRISWEPLLSAATGAVLVGVMALRISSVFSPLDDASGPQPRFTLEQLKTEQGKILADQHVAHLGAELFSRHLVAVEVAGTLLLVALVGTVAIVAHAKSQRTAQRGATHD